MDHRDVSGEGKLSGLQVWIRSWCLTGKVNHPNPGAIGKAVEQCDCVVKNASVSGALGPSMKTSELRQTVEPVVETLYDCL